MIKRLRTKLIALSMSALLAVLALVIGSVNAVNYARIVEDADAVLAVLAANDGMFPRVSDRQKSALFKRLSPEAPYESRFFSVLLDGAGAVIAADTGKIAAIDTTSAIAYAQRVFAQGGVSGFLGNYRFIRQDTGGQSRIIFLDCSKSLRVFQDFLLASCGISLAGFLSVLLLVTLLSGRIVRPVSRSYEKQKQFITDAGHEIKTPLTIIAADADILELEVGGNEWLQDIQKQTKRLAALTNDLIYLSKMEEERVALQTVEFPLSDVVSETAQSFQAPAKMQGKTFSCQIQPLLSLNGDEKALRQLVSILLDNALKYAPEGGAIALSLEPRGRLIQLTVRNTTAEPVPAENLAHFFDRFYRADPSRNSQTGGHGIGLSIAKAIVAAHKGKISAAAQDGPALQITVTLPA